MAKARFSRNLLPLWLACIAVGIVLLMLWTPSGNSHKSPWAVVFVSGFFLLLLIPLLLSRHDQSLGRKMQAGENAAISGVRTETEPPPATEEIPVPAFALEIITTDNIPPLSSDASLLVERGRSLYKERLRIDRQGVWFLFVSHLTIALLGRVLGSPYPLPPLLVTCLLATFLALMVLGHPGKVRLILVPAGWLILSLTCVGVTAVLAAIYAVRGFVHKDLASLGLALAAIVVVVAHTLWTRRRNQELRRTVMAHQPLKLLFLWVFDTMNPALLFLGFAAVWRFIGTMQLLNGAGFMGDSVDIAKSFAKGKSADLIVKTPEELSERLRTFNDAPGAMAMYPHHTLLCNDAVWKMALRKFLDEADVVLMDLRGFSPVNQGATYELRQLIDGFSTARFLLLADASTDVDFLSASLRLAWTSMATDSPNRRTSAPIRLFHLGRGTGQPGQFPPLYAIAREGDHLVGLLCERAVTAAG